MRAVSSPQDSHQNIAENCRGLRLTRQFEEILKETCVDIFSAYRTVLVTEPVDYIVAAVWGTENWGALTSIQSEIFARLKPAVERMQTALDSETLDADQAFVRGYMIRGLLIARFFFMIELWKRTALTRETELQPAPHPLHWVEPLGTA